MDITQIFLDLAIILLFTKLFGMLMRKLGLPQVVGMVIAGLLIGPAIWSQFGWGAPIDPAPEEADFLDGIAEIGVVLILFSAGLETDVKELRRSGLKATLIAFGGVLVPMGLGFLVAVPFLGGFSALSDSAIRLDAIFVGVILAATSVGITVETLKEMGKLKGRVGTTILSAAIIDDVIGIVVLSIVLGFKDPSVEPASVCINIVLFFILAFIVGFALYFLFKWLDKRWPHSRRIPIFGLVLCFACAYCADKFFGIADITGAYVAGIILCNIKDSNYIERKMDVSSYMIFGPVFFASIGLQTSFDNFDLSMLWFSIALVAVALLTKVIGCGGTARLCRFNTPDSLKIGIGMMNRGEVGLIVAKKGLDMGIISAEFFTPIIILIIVSSLVTPILLKLVYSKWPYNDAEPDTAAEDKKILSQEVVGATYNITEEQFKDDENQ